MVRMLSQNDILSDTENQAVNIGGLANTDNWKKNMFLTEAVHPNSLMLCLVKNISGL